MSTNQYAQVDYRINSLLMGANCYRVLSGEEEFNRSPLEEMTAPMRQMPGRSYMRCRTDSDKEELWMVPFSMGEAKLEWLLDVMEEVLFIRDGNPCLHFPVDLVANSDTKALILRPVDRSVYLPLRTYLPSIPTPRWKIAASLFRRVAQMKEAGITSNGISREQLRVGTEDHEVHIWFNETISTLSQSKYPDRITRHVGFLSIPEKTEQDCLLWNHTIDGARRDVFSAAIVAFYLIMHTHPFVGSSFYGLVRSDYLNIYQIDPKYIMEPGTENNPGNQRLSRLVTEQWNRTVPELKALFDGLFLAVSHPETWNSTAPYWDPQNWIRALEADQAVNDKEIYHIDYHFENDVYHLV